MRKSGVAEKYVRVVQDMYERSRTVVWCAVLHQGSALSPFLFAIVMDQLSEEVRQESPWTMMFADDIVICSESREQVEENLERWRFALERRGMKVSRSKTEYMCVNEREGSGTVRLKGEEVKKVQEFKYLGSTVQSNGECGKEVKKRVQAGWNGWRKVSGVLCYRKISARIKGKVYRTVVRPAMLYGLETVSLRKRQESELEVAELKMLRFSLGVTRLDRIRNEYIRGTAHVGRLGDKVREARLRWFGHVQRRERFKEGAVLPSISRRLPTPGCLCMYGSYVALPADIDNDIHYTPQVGIILHYSSLSTMLWLVLTARNTCNEVSKAPPLSQERDPPTQPHTKFAIFRFYLFSSGIPIVIVGVTAAVNLDNYGSRDNAPYCWMAWEPSMGGFYGPTAVLVLVMCMYFLCTFVQLKRHPERKYELKAMTEEQQRLATAEIGHCHAASGEPGEQGDHSGCMAITASMLANEHSFKAQLRATAFTVFLFLATWAFGALAVSQGHYLAMIFSCLYGAFSVTLGLFMLIQHCAKRDDVWHRWWACCPSKPKLDVNGETAESTESKSHFERKRPDAEPLSSVYCPKTDPFSGASQGDTSTDTMMHSSTKMTNKEEDIMLHLDIPPPRATMPSSQATLSRKGTLSRRGTLSHNSSLHEDYVFSPDSTAIHKLGHKGLGVTIVTAK
ncbi:hypothetical protein QTP70_011718 [Hemibagrus guttatus]|uniref:ribonuclease H n=1 Tax=Hemibagrus guttatus TaxID=175788 RepID=A0AAE0QQ11_9TELE|nr:hypothetical protein QTP70_011718 [Hemibagrus guttatus]